MSDPRGKRHDTRLFLSRRQNEARGQLGTLWFRSLVSLQHKTYCAQRALAASGRSQQYARLRKTVKTQDDIMVTLRANHVIRRVEDLFEGAVLARSGLGRREYFQYVDGMCSGSQQHWA